MSLPVTAKRMQLGVISCFPICRFNQQNKQNFNTAQCCCAATLKIVRHQIERTGAISQIVSNMLPNMTPAKSDSRRRLNAGAATSHGGDYIKVEEDQTDGFVDEQWTAPIGIDEAKPWKIITIILSLFVSGSICMICAAFDWMAEQSERSDRIWALVIIGVLTIIPGGYYVFVLSCILLRRSGYTWDDIRRLG